MKKRVYDFLMLLKFYVRKYLLFLILASVSSNLHF